MTFGKTALRCWLPAAALLLALLCPLPVAAARVGTAIPVSVRTDGAAADAVYTVELTPLDAAPAPVQRALTVKNGGTVYFTGFAFDEPGDYRYLVAERSGGWHTDREGCRPGGAAANRGRLPHRGAGRRVLRKHHRVWNGVEKAVNPLTAASRELVLSFGSKRKNQRKLPLFRRGAGLCAWGHS